ncbi:hypothetical protein HS088_TW17G00294 [Tripterygium wilfordii]|uniref:FAF domain-containing protein n=1 Tax=Tripterygium wilfordii TaxID=458696 RepID=A0A7J7CF10_TRIWF|nr:protein FANTASTIC FOUR 3-like [Tripterygium wilfordii]KAF5732764.1 hypothetical protein HS088_TW17G00294 [Tripterygium wilfordii]
MSSSVCQGLDFNLFNASLKPSLTDSEVHKEENNMKSNDNIDMRGWSFLQSLSNISEINNNNNNKEAIENEKVYVHPLQNRFSSSKLSTKSLEMCTESLGSETGSDCSESSDEIHFTPSQEQLDNFESSPKYYKNRVTQKRMKRCASFPPPLTSISGTSGVRLRPHREGGRLILKAESASSCLNYFQAERSNGRLRLSLPKHFSPDCNHDEDEDEDVEEEEADVDESETETQDIEKIDTDVGETEETDEIFRVEGEENGVKVRGEMGAKKLSITSRCKEGERGRKGLLNWEPFWVAS